MQDRYAGDVGDFGKLGMLRCLSEAGLSVGVNWYRVPDGGHNDDGKHIGYLQNSDFFGCDDFLLGQLGQMVYGNQRSISFLENAMLIPNAHYYQAVLESPNSQCANRSAWHKQATEALLPCDIVFLDPDNGLLVDSVSPTSKKSNKYVFLNELADYYALGKSVVFYNHRSRVQERDYIARFQAILRNEIFPDAHLLGLKFTRGTIRDYFFIINSSHYQKLESAITRMLQSKWNKHFIKLDMP